MIKPKSKSNKYQVNLKASEPIPNLSPILFLYLNPMKIILKIQFIYLVELTNKILNHLFLIKTPFLNIYVITIPENSLQVLTLIISIFSLKMTL
jgi:hypothetical protein